MPDLLAVDLEPTSASQLQSLIRPYGFSLEEVSAPECLARFRDGDRSALLLNAHSHIDPAGVETIGSLVASLREIDLEVPIFLWADRNDDPDNLVFEVRGIDGVWCPQDDAKTLQAKLLCWMRLGKIQRESLAEGFRGDEAATLQFRGVAYGSAYSHEIFSLAARLGAHSFPVLITGPEGVGKTKLAETIHTHSARNRRPFVHFETAKCSPLKMNEELFGIPRQGIGSDKSGQKAIGKLVAAQASTLYIDEIVRLDLDAQEQLLGLLSQRDGDPSPSAAPRIIVSSATNLQAAVTAGTFSAALYECLSTFMLPIPALKDRPGDILPLAEHFLLDFMDTLADDSDMNVLDEACQATLLEHDWPGNAKEVGERMRRALFVANGQRIQSSFFGLQAPPSLRPEASKTVVARPKRNVGARRSRMHKTASGC